MLLNSIKVWSNPDSRCDWSQLQNHVIQTLWPVYWLCNSLGVQIISMKTIISIYKVDPFFRNWLSETVEKSLDLSQSPSLLVKIQIIGRKVCLRCKGKTFLGDVNKLFVFKSFLTMPSNVLPLYHKHTIQDTFKEVLAFKANLIVSINVEMRNVPYTVKSRLLMRNTN